jgi:LacI family transcriptional regulator
MATTLKDVAKLSGVHPSTVSRVLRNKENIPISNETRERILKAVEELHYQPDITARALRLKKSNAIGLIIPDILNSFFAGVARSVERECAKAGYTLLVSETNEDQENEIRSVNDLYSRGIDGLIIAPVQNSDEHIRDLRDKNFPFVLIDRCFEDIETNYVISDNEKAAYNAIVHLIELGHKRIAFLSSRREIYPVYKRLIGYKKAIADFKLHETEELIAGTGFTLENGFQSTLQLLSLPNPPTAMLSSGNVITIGAMQAILEKGLSIPEDISLIAFTDTIYSPYLVCPMTTISHSVQEIGNKAFEILLSNMTTENSTPCSKIIIETEFTKRNSTIKHPNN